MNRKVIAALGLFAVAGVGTSVPAMAQTQERTARESRSNSTDNAENPNQIICIRGTMVGSRIPKQDCRTRREWERHGGVPTGDA